MRFYRALTGPFPLLCMQLFPRLKYLQGGVSSGFVHVTGVKGPARLYQVKSPNRTSTQVRLCNRGMIAWLCDCVIV